VRIKIESPSKEPLLVVHYEGWNKYYDEIIKQGSSRVAPSGTYTSRLDIPKYQLKQENAMVGVIINRINPPKKEAVPPNSKPPTQGQ
jgi:hypothetical protein